ncbi:MAG TPA: response regulator [Nitrososphaeraceae archaeon]|jgi:CheY-like chemotaxis protein|nr:response regulator [Nitrososphaeraceae archaeon]
MRNLPNGPKVAGLSTSKNPKTVRREEEQEKKTHIKRILVIDDEPDVTLTFKVGLEEYQDTEKRRIFEVDVYNDPKIAVLQFNPNLYDLLLTDIFMPKMNGLELYHKIVKMDPNIRVCFMSAAEANIEALREVYPNVSFGCFIQKPVTIDKLVTQLLTELN